MAKQAAGTHQPLSYRAHVRLRALHKNLHSRFQAVRAAAAKEIQAILNKKRGIQNRLRELAVKTARATVRKVTPSQLHKPLRVQKQAPQQTRGRGQGTPLGAEQVRGRGFTPPHGFGQTKEQLKERARGNGRRAQSGGPAPVMPAHLTDDAIQQRWQGAWDGGVREGRERAGQQRQNGQRQNGQRQPDAMKQAQDAMRQAHAQPPRTPQPPRTGHGPVRDLYSPDSVLSADDRQARERERKAAAAAQPARPTAREKVKAAGAPIRDVARDPGSEYAPAHTKAPPLPGDPEARLQPGEKRRWARVPKNAGDAPERTRSSRSRNRTTA